MDIYTMALCTLCSGIRLLYDECIRSSSVGVNISRGIIQAFRIIVRCIHYLLWGITWFVPKRFPSCGRLSDELPSTNSGIEFGVWLDDEATDTLEVFAELDKCCTGYGRENSVVHSKGRVNPQGSRVGVHRGRGRGH